MPTITAGAILEKCEIILQDTTNIRWPTTELLGWLNDAQREIVAFRPDACNKIAQMNVVAGTKQTVPADGYQLLNVIRNFDSGGTTPGRAIRKVPQELLDAQLPDWHSATPAATVQHYTYDPRSPRTFYVYPPSTGTTKLEVLYSASPTTLAATTDVISVDDIYANVLMDYVLYRAYSKDFELTGNQQRAEYHYNKFETSLGKKAAVDTASAQVDEVRG